MPMARSLPTNRESPAPAPKACLGLLLWPLERTTLPSVLSSSLSRYTPLSFENAQARSVCNETSDGHCLTDDILSAPTCVTIVVRYLPSRLSVWVQQRRRCGISWRISTLRVAAIFRIILSTPVQVTSHVANKENHKVLLDLRN
jgi:hypothetical protein